MSNKNRMLWNILEDRNKEIRRIQKEMFDLIELNQITLDVSEKNQINKINETMNEVCNQFASFKIREIFDKPIQYAKKCLKIAKFFNSNIEYCDTDSIIVKLNQISLGNIVERVNKMMEWISVESDLFLKSKISSKAEVKYFDHIKLVLNKFTKFYEGVI